MAETDRRELWCVEIGDVVLCCVLRLGLVCPAPEHLEALRSVGRQLGFLSNFRRDTQNASL